MGVGNRMWLFEGDCLVSGGGLIDRCLAKFLEWAPGRLTFETMECVMAFHCGGWAV